MKNIILMFVFASLIACSSNDESIDPAQIPDPSVTLPDTLPFIPRKDIQLNEEEKLLPEATNTFAFNLIKTVYADETVRQPHKNILLSPLSANLALSMLNNGAAGKTREEIQQALGYGGVSPETINTYAQKLIDAMQTLDNRGVFESANSIWTQNGFPVLDAFKKLNQQYYEAEVQSVDFSKPSALSLINGWASEKTHGKIPEILESVDPETRLALLNALYFKGYWTTPFDKELTADAAFHASDGSEQMVPTMRQTAIQPYVKLENSAVTELNFGNRAFSLVVVLPDEGTSISTLVEQMDAGWWAKLTHELAMSGWEVDITIPRFKMEYDRMLADDLQALGMKEMFNKVAANFSGISPAPLFVSTVRQKTFARMDEEGMEAAAVTVIGMVGSAGIKFEHVDFKVNRPFMYFIKEQSTGLVSFTGVMNRIDN
ncbi:MAG: serpin family protein [Bacteroidales bacterium]|jgi:serpin B|nr:serpin family protein [Bacteroidales bacterium]